MPEGHLVSAPPLCPPCSAPQGQAESGGMVLVAYAGPVRPAAALRDSVLCLPTDIHSLFVNKPSSSSSSSSSFIASALNKLSSSSPLALLTQTEPGLTIDALTLVASRLRTLPRPLHPLCLRTGPVFAAVRVYECARSWTYVPASSCVCWRAHLSATPGIYLYRPALVLSFSRWR